MSEVDELPAAGVRPPSLGEPAGPAVKVGRVLQPGAFEQPSLDVPVLQMEDQLVDVLGYFSSLVPVVAEQVIEVPKVVCPRRAVTPAEVMDVSVITQLCSSRFRRVRGGASASVHRQYGWFSSCFTETGLTVQTVQKTEIPQGAVLGLGHAHRCATTGSDGPDSSVWRCRRCSSCKVVDVPAVSQVVPEFPAKPGGASDSVHRSDGVFGAFCAIFRAPPGSPGVERQFSQLGALDDEEFFVIEGWGVALTPGVVLPGVRPPVVH